MRSFWLSKNWIKNVDSPLNWSYICILRTLISFQRGTVGLCRSTGCKVTSCQSWRMILSSVFEFSVRWWGIILRICWKPISVSNSNWTLIWHLRKVPWALRKVWQPGGKSADSDFPRVWKTFPQADRLSTRAHIRVPFGRFTSVSIHSSLTPYL